jgi:hypothetical protein
MSLECARQWWPEDVIVRLDTVQKCRSFLAWLDRLPPSRGGAGVFEELELQILTLLLDGRGRRLLDLLATRTGLSWLRVPIFDDFRTFAGFSRLESLLLDGGVLPHQRFSWPIGLRELVVKRVLTSSRSFADVLASLVPLPRLELLKLHDLRAMWPVDQARFLAALQRLTALTRLELTADTTRTTDGAHVTSWLFGDQDGTARLPPTLRVLLSYDAFHPRDLLSGELAAPDLHSLDVLSSLPADMPVVHLRNLPALRHFEYQCPDCTGIVAGPVAASLTYLCIEGERGVPTGLHTCTALRDLTVRLNPACPTLDGVSALASATALTSLFILCEAHEQRWSVEPLACLTRLERLRLWFSSSHVLHLTALRRLTLLDLRTHRHRGAVALPVLPRLRCLAIPAGPFVRCLVGLRALQQLYVDGTVTAEQVAQEFDKARLPHLRVVYSSSRLTPPPPNGRHITFVRLTPGAVNCERSGPFHIDGGLGSLV